MKTRFLGVLVACMLVLPLAVHAGFFDTFGGSHKDSKESQGGAQAGTPETRQIVEDAAAVVKEISVEEENFGPRLAQAVAVYIIPRMIKAGLGIGCEAGSGVLLTKDGKGGWSSPAFIKQWAASVGFQLGVQSKAIVVTIHNPRMVAKILDGDVELGVDASVAAGRAGAGGEVTTADAYYFIKTNKGLMYNLTIEGGSLKISGTLNRDYYGRPVKAAEIIIDYQVSHPHARVLQDTLKAVK